MTPHMTDYDELWRGVKASLHVGDLLRGEVHSRNDWWLNIDIGLPLLGNLDAADVPPSITLGPGDHLDVRVKGFDDRRRQVRVSALPDGTRGAEPPVKIPPSLRGPVRWPPPVADGVSVEEWSLQRDSS